MAGLEALFENDHNVFTDPETARKFAEATEVDALAVSIGNVHGVYRKVLGARVQYPEKVGHPCRHRQL